MLIPILTYFLVLDCVVAHTPSETSDQSISKYNSGHFGQHRRFLVFLIDAVLKIHNFNSTDRHLHGVELCHQKHLKVVIIFFSIFIGVKIDVDV